MIPCVSLWFMVFPVMPSRLPVPSNLASKAPSPTHDIEQIKNAAGQARTLRQAQGKQPVSRRDGLTGEDARLSTLARWK